MMRCGASRDALEEEEDGMEFTDYSSFYQMLGETVESGPGNTAYKSIMESGGVESVSWSEFHDQVRRAAKSLVALGVNRHDKVNILSYTCYRWVLTGVAAMSIGVCTVGIYQTLLAKDVQYIVDHSDAVLVFAEDEAQLAKLMEIKDEIPDIRKVILIKGDAPADDWVIGYDEFLELGNEVSDDEFDRRTAEVTSGDPAGIVYTSGTTGVPKGAVLTHDNITFTAQSVNGSLEVLDGDETLLFLPLAHVFARVIAFASLYKGATVVFSRGLDFIVDDLQVSRPHWFASVPRIYEKVYSKIISGAEAKGGLALKIFRWAVEVGRQVSDLKMEGRSIPALTGLKYGLATKLVFSKVHAALGGRARFCISGAAPLNPDIAKFFHGAGVLILEGIGMTENTSFTNVNRIDNYRFGWVGPTGPGIEQMTADDGEILYRGRNVMKEYYKMPEQTAETITEDGWQYTGDLGEIDDEGFLRVTGRKKDLIITAGGKNIAPSAIEGLIATSKYIGQVCVIGDRQKYLTALVTVDPDNIQDYATEHGIEGEGLEDIQKNEAIVKLIEAEVEEKNKALASFETIKKIRIVDEFTIENGMLTPTLKVKRNIALDRHQEVIDDMYAEA
jgi:long-chain acyl-CoA synthetase